MSLFGRRVRTGPRSLRLLSRPGCHLCEEMKAVVAPLLLKTGGILTVVDVDSDPVLLARWGNEIPVLLDEEGRVVAKVRDSASLPQKDWATLKPRSKFGVPGRVALRADRSCSSGLAQPPPRKTRKAPEAGPVGSVTGPAG